MAHRKVHYEAAFEDYLRSGGIPYVAVDEAKRSAFADVALKSFDFLVYSESGPNLIVDVKGRKFPDAAGQGPKRQTKAWENWVTRDDVVGLEQWQRVFGGDFLSVLVFAYWLQGPAQRSPFDVVHAFRERTYAFVAVTLGEYVTLSRPRSSRWQTLAVPSEVFSRHARELAGML